MASAVLRDNRRPSESLDTLVNRAEVPGEQPGQRYQTMDEVQAALTQSVTTPVKEAPSIACCRLPA